jgi:hypothetical protein
MDLRSPFLSNSGAHVSGGEFPSRSVRTGAHRLLIALRMLPVLVQAGAHCMSGRCRLGLVVTCARRVSVSTSMWSDNGDPDESRLASPAPHAIADSVEGSWLQVGRDRAFALIGASNGPPLATRRAPVQALFTFLISMSLVYILTWLRVKSLPRARPASGIPCVRCAAA